MASRKSPSKRGAADTSFDSVAEAYLHLLKSRGVDWLFANAPPDPRWCLIHATHASEGEISRIARSGAVAGWFGGIILIGVDLSRMASANRL